MQIGRICVSGQCWAVNVRNTRESFHPQFNPQGRATLLSKQKKHDEMGHKLLLFLLSANAAISRACWVSCLRKLSQRMLSQRMLSQRIVYGSVIYCPCNQALQCKRVKFAEDSLRHDTCVENDQRFIKIFCGCESYLSLTFDTWLLGAITLRKDYLEGDWGIIWGAVIRINSRNVSNKSCRLRLISGTG